MVDEQQEVEDKAVETKDASLGASLKEYREQRGNDIYEVAEALCLSPEIIKALEEEDFDSLPEPPYVRGYLRSYAKFAEIDPKAIIDLYETQRGANPNDLEYHFKPTSNENIPKPIISPNTIRLGLLALLLLVLGSISMIPAVNSWISETWNGFAEQTAQQNYASNQENEQLQLAENQMPAPLPGEAPDIPPVMNDAEQNPASAEETDKEDTPADAKETDGKATEDEDAAADADKKSQESATADETSDQEKKEEAADQEATEDSEDSKQQEGDTKLQFNFKSEVWMRIRDKNNKTVFESLSPAGTEKEIKLNKPMTFRIGNAGGVQIFVEGKPLDIEPFTKGSVANFTIE